MKHFRFKENFKSPKYIMDLVGIWPESSPNFGYKLYTVLVFAGTFLVTACYFVQSVLEFRRGKMENGCFGMCLVIASGHAAFKVWYLQIDKPKFLKIIDALTDPSLTSHEDDSDFILQEQLVFSRRIRNFLLSSCLLAVSMSCVSDLIQHPSITSPMIPFRADIDDLPLFILIWILTIVTTIYVGYIIAAYEGLIVTLLSMGNAQLKILNKQIRDSLENLSPRTNSQDETKEIDLKVNALLRECVLRHNAIERYIDAVEYKFSTGFLVQLLLSLMVTGLIGFCIAFVSKNSVDFYKCIFFFVADMAQIAIVYFPCNEIILQSEYIRDACYMSNWNYCGTSVAKTLIIMMERSKRPFGFTARKFTIISIQTFIQLLRTAMSYFTVLKSVYLND